MSQNQPVNLINYVNSVFEKNENVLKYFYSQLFQDFNPDINGYNLVFLIPPDLSGWKKSELYSQTNQKSYFFSTSKIITFASIDFTPPINQINTEKISSRNGAIPYATEITNTDQCSVTYIDNNDIDIYHMHHMWLEYIRAVVDGIIEPDDKYISSNDNEYLFGAIDYAASFFIVKYSPNLKRILFIGKCIGVFPQASPSKELVGQRASNELTTLPYSYFCSAYREATWRESSHWIFEEFYKSIQSRF